MEYFGSFTDLGALNLPVAERDRQRVLSLAREWAELAAGEEMSKKKRWWKATNDLKMEVPLVLFESLDVAGFISDEDLECEHPMLRNVERFMLHQLKQINFIGDDSVLEPYFRIPWRIKLSDYEVGIVRHRLENSLANVSNFPIRTHGDLSQFKPREFIVDRERSLELKKILEDIWGDILPVRLGNVDWLYPDYGFNPFTGMYASAITYDLFNFLGYERMCTWMVEEPDDIHAIMRYITDDRKSFYLWLESEGLLDFVNDNQMVVPSGYGYSSEIPAMDSPLPAKLSDLWGRTESQESIVISAAMFDEFVLPYLAEVSGMFAICGYGCCEPLEDRIELIKERIPNVRNFSISHWNKSPEKIAESVGKDYVYLMKPFPAFISGETPDWDAIKKELERTWACTKDKNVEFIARDCIDIRDHNTLPKWVSLCKSITGR